MSVLATIREENGLDITSENWRSHLERSELLIEEKDFENAASNLSQLLDFLSGHKNLVSQIDLSRCYLRYGKALLKSAQYSNKWIMEELGKSGTERTRMERKIEKKVMLNIDERRKKKKEEEEEEKGLRTVKTMQSQHEINRRPTGGGGGGGVATKDVLHEDALTQMLAKSSREEREDAWEALEMARLLCEGFLKTTRTNSQMQRYVGSIRMEIHSSLGELQMENHNFKQSVEEFEKAIDYYHRHSIDNIHELIFFHSSCSKSAEAVRLSTAYQFHLKITVNLLYKRLVQMLIALGTCPNEENIEETLQSVTDTLANEGLRRKMGRVMYQNMVELQALLDDVLAKEIQLVEEEIKEGAHRNTLRTSGTSYGQNLYECDKENIFQQNNVAGTQISESCFKTNFHDLLKINRRKRTFCEAGIRDGTAFEPKSKKFKSELIKKII